MYKFKFHGTSGHYLTHGKVYTGDFHDNEDGDIPFIVITNDRGEEAVVSIYNFELIQ